MSKQKDKLREKIARMFWGIQINQTELMIEPAKWDRLNSEQREFLLSKADQILALIPDIEEAKKQEMAKFYHWLSTEWKEIDDQTATYHRTAIEKYFGQALKEEK